jgi:hypothetical protein
VKPRLADPSSLPHRQGPDLVAHPGSVLRCSEIEDLQLVKIVCFVESDEFPTGGIDVEGHAVEVGEADEIRRTLQERRETRGISNPGRHRC